VSDSRAVGADEYDEPRHPIEEIIEEIEDVADKGVKWYCRVTPGLWGKSVVEHAKMLDIAARLRQRMPQEMSEAITIARQRERIIREAQEQRDRIIQAAREQAQILVSTDELVRQAQEKSDQILHAARTEADATRAEAEAWARGVIERLDGNLRRVLSTLERAKKSLGGGFSDGGGSDRGSYEDQP
jgi:vacuolar-type H+-ATPase subunit H